jgi:8-oxo-dGTP pyrophosphatase MutT (NUDIX family)
MVQEGTIPSWREPDALPPSFPQEHHVVEMDDELSMWAESARGRDGEVVLVLRRPDGRVLLHTKHFYPADTWRLPSGGVEPGESPQAAARREIAEETGLPPHMERLLGILTYEMQRAGERIPFGSYVFLVDVEGGRPAPRDAGEEISGFRWVLPEELEGVSAQLCGLARPWAGWGTFRSLPHSFVAGLLAPAGGRADGDSSTRR